MIEKMRLMMVQRVFWYAVLCCYMAVLLFLSLNPWIRPTSTDDVFSPDKLDHAFAYGGLSIILFLGITKPVNAYLRSTAHAWMAAIFISALIGVLIEVAQSLFTRNRTGSAEDALANAIGAVVGYAVYITVKYIHGKLSSAA